jgi:protein Hikeshi
MFGLIISSRPVDTAGQVLSPTQYAFSIPSSPSFSHIVVFLLPGTQLPPDTAAAVYIQLPGNPQFKFLGAIANEKPSAIFKVNVGGAAAGEDAMTDAIPTALGGPNVTLGLSVEPVAQVAQSLATLKASQQQSSGASTGLELVRAAPPPNPMATKELAQKIIQNAFNFLSSFAGNVGPNGVEVVPLKAFQDWWTKFERRVTTDPGFLERSGN